MNLAKSPVQRPLCTEAALVPRQAKRPRGAGPSGRGTAGFLFWRNCSESHFPTVVLSIICRQFLKSKNGVRPGPAESRFPPVGPDGARTACAVRRRWCVAG